MTVETLDSDGREKKGVSLRRTTQSGQAALLGQAIHAAVEISKFHSKHTYTAQKIQQSEGCRARREMSGELNRLSGRAFREVRQLLEKPEVFRSPNELADVLSSLPTAEYRKLYEYMLKKSIRHLPPPWRARLGGEGAGRKDESGRMRDEG